MRKNRYSNGRYGVVDIFRRNIWINTDNEAIAHAIRKTFSSKAGLIVYDLSIFENVSQDPPTVDSDCCLDWQIDVEFNENVTNVNLANPATTKTQTQHRSKKLINSPIVSLLTPERQHELQQQMLLYAHILTETKLHVKLDSAEIQEQLIRLNLDPGTDYNGSQFRILEQVDRIFARELDIADIERQLEDLANWFFETYPWISGRILRALDKLYA